MPLRNPLAMECSLTSLGDTIYAPATAPGRAAISIVRISGAATRGVADILMATLPPPRMAAVRSLRSASGDDLDKAMVLWLPGPATFTGEDMLELHLHGGRAVLSAVLGTIGAIDGCRPAEPGEFTRRALLSGRLDATEAEAIADLVDADTSAQRGQALRQLSGALSAEADRWRTALIRAMAHIEAYIDFPDEEIPTAVVATVRAEINTIAMEMRERLGDRRGAIVREGYRVAIVGRPNVGKSTLMNALAGRDVAIVTDIPGTTRDVLEVTLDLSGYAVILADMAGLRDTADPVEKEGVRRAERWSQEADLRLVLHTAEAPPHPAPDHIDVSVLTKIDRLSPIELAEAGDAYPESVAISGLAGTGLKDLLNRVEAALKNRLSGSGTAVLTRDRHRQAVTGAATALERFQSWDGDPNGIELAAEDLRAAVAEIGRLTGRIDVDDLLDVIFRDFCLGK